MTWKLVRMLKTYKTCNSTVRFSKYEFYNKLLGGDHGVTLLRITSSVNWTQSIIYLDYLYLIEKNLNIILKIYLE